jgi:hypothetical protein
VEYTLQISYCDGKTVENHEKPLIRITGTGKDVHEYKTSARKVLYPWSGKNKNAVLKNLRTIKSLSR